MFDSLEEAIFLIEHSYDKRDTIDFEQVAQFIVGQQVKHGKDAGIFVETMNVSSPKSRLCSGEKLQTYLATKNIRTIAATKALIQSRSTSAIVQSAIDLAENWLEKQCFSHFCAVGECRHSTIAFMRLVNVQGKLNLLNKMIDKLSTYRDGKGGWKGFPYFYTLLSLVEFDNPKANEEIRYALDYSNNISTRSRIDEPYATRRRDILYQMNSRFNRTLSTHV